MEEALKRYYSKQFLNLSIFFVLLKFPANFYFGFYYLLIFKLLGLILFLAFGKKMYSSLNTQSLPTSTEIKDFIINKGKYIVLSY